MRLRPTLPCGAECKKQCTNYANNAYCCDGVWLPSFYFRNAACGYPRLHCVAKSMRSAAAAARACRAAHTWAMHGGLRKRNSQPQIFFAFFAVFSQDRVEGYRIFVTDPVVVW